MYLCIAHNYLPDFTYENFIFEIKPSCYIIDKVKAKENAAIIYALENNKTFQFITEDWFYENYNESILDFVEHEETRIKMKRNLKSFKII